MNEEGRITSTTEPQESFLFKPASWQSKIDFIHHLTQFNNVLTVVLAERQGGKSTFAQLVKQSLDASMKSCVIDIKDQSEPELLNNRIAELIDLTESGSIASLIQQINEQRMPVFLMIDNAQYINELWLSAFLNAMQEQGDNNFLHVCMMADYSVVPLLNRVIADKFQNLVHSIELGGLKENECRTYILHRARQLGLESDYINDALFKRIYKATAGDIAQINQNLNQLLAQGAPNNQHFSAVKIGAVAAGLGVFALGMAYLMQPSMRLDYKKQIAENPGPSVAVNEMQRPDASGKQPQTVQISYLPSHIPEYRQAAMIAKKMPLPSFIHRLDMAQASHKMIPTPAEKNHLASLEPQQKPIQQASQIPSLSTEAMKEAVERYTIQLLASTSEKDLRHFISQAGIEKRATIQKIQKEGTDWYILTLGEFRSFTKAKKELNELPSNIVAHKPWIRPVRTA